MRDSGRALHGTALSCALQSLGFDRKEVMRHGFRATACTLLNEMGWRPEAIERQIAHGGQTSLGNRRRKESDEGARPAPQLPT